MRKLLIAVYIVVFWGATNAMQGMQDQLIQIKNDNNDEAKAYKEKYVQTLSELSRDYLYVEDHTCYDYNFNPVERLVVDAVNGREIKSVKEYGAKKRSIPKEKKPLRYISLEKNIFCQNCNPVETIETYFSNIHEKIIQDNNNILPTCQFIDHCIKDFKHKQCSIITLINLLPKERWFSQKRRAIFAVLQGHLILKKVLNEKSYIVDDAIENEYFLRDLLDYGIKISTLKGYTDEGAQESLARNAIRSKSSNIAALMLLKEHGINFENPQLIDIALQKKSLKRDNNNLCLRKNLTCLSFLLDQQLNISLDDIEKRIDWAFPKYKDSYILETYKAMLRFRLIKSIRPLEKIIIDKLKQDECKKKYDDLQNLFVKNDKLFNRTEVQALINKFLEAQKDSDLLHQLIAEIETKQNLKSFLSDIKGLKVSKFLLNLIIGLDIGVSCLGTMFCTGNLQNLALGYMVVRACSSMFGAAFLLGQSENLYDWAIREMPKQIQMNYLKGYLKGLQMKSNANQATNWQYYEKKFKKLNSIHKQICQYVLSGLIPLTIVYISESESIMWKSLGLTGMCFWGIGRSVINRLTEFNEKNVKELLADFFNRGYQDGCARIVGEQLQLQEEEIEKPEPGFFKVIFGSIATYSKNLFAELVSHIPKYTIRNPDKNLAEFN